MTTETKTRTRPSFALEKIEGEPPPSDRAAPAKDQLFDNLEAITEDPGEWYQVAEYRTSNGAKKAHDSITGYTDRKGVEHPATRVLPEGHLYELEVRTRLLDGDKRGSVLYARCIDGME